MSTRRASEKQVSPPSKRIKLEKESNEDDSKHQIRQKVIRELEQAEEVTQEKERSLVPQKTQLEKAHSVDTPTHERLTHNSSAQSSLIYLWKDGSNEFEDEENSLTCHNLSSCSLSVGAFAEEVAEARQEATVVSRIGQLQKEGLWPAKHLPKVMEVPRKKVHWDYLLQNMRWMATDFQMEYKWKRDMAKKLGLAVEKYFLEKEESRRHEEKMIKDAQRRNGTQVAGIVEKWWYDQQHKQASMKGIAESEHIENLLETPTQILSACTERHAEWFAEACQSDWDVYDDDFNTCEVTLMIDRVDTDFKPTSYLYDSDGSSSIDSSPLGIDRDREAEAEAEEKMLLEYLEADSRKPLNEVLNESLPSQCFDSDCEDDTSDSMDEDSNDTSSKYRNEIASLQEEAHLPIDDLLCRYGTTLETVGDLAYVESTSEESALHSSVSDEESSDDDKDMAVEEKDEEEMAPVYSSASSMQATADEAMLDDVDPITGTLGPSCVVCPHLRLAGDESTALGRLCKSRELRVPTVVSSNAGTGEAEQLLVGYLGYLAGQLGDWGCHLMVVPSALLVDWELRLRRFCPGLRVNVGEGGSPPALLGPYTGGTHVYVTSYTAVMQHNAELATRKWRTVILDQVQLLTSSRCPTDRLKEWYEVLSNLPCGSHRVLSFCGEMPETVTELGALLHLTIENSLLVGLSDALFVERVENSQDDDLHIIDELQKFLDPFIIRIEEDCEAHDACIEERTVMCSMTHKQRHIYNSLISSPSARSSLRSGHLLDVLEVVGSARHICNHPRLLEEMPLFPRSPFASEPSLLTYHLPETMVAAVLDLRNAESGLGGAMTYLSLCPAAREVEGYTRGRVHQLMPRQGMIEELANRTDDDEEEMEKKETVLCAENAFIGREDVQVLRVEESAELAVVAAKDSNKARDLALEVAPWRQPSLRSLPKSNGAASTPNATKPGNSNAPSTLAGRRSRALLKSRLAALARENERRCCLPVDGSQWLTSSLRARLEMVHTGRESDREVHQAAWETLYPRCLVNIDRVLARHPLVTSNASPRRLERLIEEMPESGLELRTRVEEATRILHPVMPHVIDFPGAEQIFAESGKLRCLSGLLSQLLLTQRQRVVLIGHSARFLDLLETCLARHPRLASVPRLCCDTSVSVPTRYASVQQFNSAEGPYLLLVAGRCEDMGIGLLEAREGTAVVLVDGEWRPAVEDAVKMRCFRWSVNGVVTSRRPLVIYRLLTENSVEDYLYRHLGNRMLLETVFTEKEAAQPIVLARVQPNVVHGLLARKTIGLSSSSNSGCSLRNAGDEDDDGVFFKRKVSLAASEVEKALELFEDPVDAQALCALVAEGPAMEAEFQGDAPLMVPRRVKKRRRQPSGLEEYGASYLAEYGIDWNKEQKRRRVDNWEVNHYLTSMEEDAVRVAVEEDDLWLAYHTGILDEVEYRDTETGEIMPTYTPFTFQEDDPDEIYVDESLAMIYETSAMLESSLPHVTSVPVPVGVAPLDTTRQLTGAALPGRRRQVGALVGTSAQGLKPGVADGAEELGTGTPKRRKIGPGMERSRMHLGRPPDASAASGRNGTPTEEQADTATNKMAVKLKDRMSHGQGTNASLGSSGGASSVTENRASSVVVTGAGAIRIYVTRPFSLKETARQFKMRRSVGIPQSQHPQAKFRTSGMQMGAHGGRWSGMPGGAQPPNDAQHLGKNLDWLIHEEASVYQSLTQTQDIHFDQATADRVPSAQAFAPNFHMTESLLNDHGTSRIYRGFRQCAYHYDHMQPSAGGGGAGCSAAFVSGTGQAGGMTQGGAGTDGMSGEPGGEMGTPGRKMKGKLKSPAGGRLGGTYGVGGGGAGAWLQKYRSFHQLQGESGDPSSQQSSALPRSVDQHGPHLKTALKNYLLKSKARTGLGPGGSGPRPGQGFTPVGSNTALAQNIASSSATPNLIVKNQTHISALHELSINPDQLITPTWVLKRKEEREANAPTTGTSGGGSGSGGASVSVGGVFSGSSSILPGVGVLSPSPGQHSGAQVGGQNTLIQRRLQQSGGRLVSSPAGGQMGGSPGGAITSAQQLRRAGVIPGRGQTMGLLRQGSLGGGTGNQQRVISSGGSGVGSGRQGTTISQQGYYMSQVRAQQSRQGGGQMMQRGVSMAGGVTRLPNQGLSRGPSVTGTQTGKVVATVGTGIRGGGAGGTRVSGAGQLSHHVQVATILRSSRQPMRGGHLVQTLPGQQMGQATTGGGSVQFIQQPGSTVNRGASVTVQEIQRLFRTQQQGQPIQQIMGSIQSSAGGQSAGTTVSGSGGRRVTEQIIISRVPSTQDRSRQGQGGQQGQNWQQE